MRGPGNLGNRDREISRGFHVGTAGPGLGGLVAVVMIVAAGAAEAQTSPEPLPIASAYGSGVHAYFAGDYPRSEELLSAAIEAGTADPRAWYFRGLAALRTGRFDEAEADFSEGARREIQRTGSWPVSRSLERVQGIDRLRLERHRVRARVAALQSEAGARKRRYGELGEAQPEVLRPSKPAAGGDEAGRPFEPTKDAEPLPKPDAPTDADDPFAPPPGDAQKADDPFGT